MTSLKVTTGAPSQLSVAVATPVALLSLHSRVTSAGAVSTGAVVSVTVMRCTADTLLPQASVAVHVLRHSQQQQLVIGITN